MRSLAQLLSGFLGCVFLWIPAGHAQWSADPSANLALADRSGPQVQPKMVARTDGGFYVSWFDSSSGGYDVYLQRVDAAGMEQWPHNGVLVADRSYSSTQDYGLAVDTGGNALLAFRDDRGGVNDEVSVAKVSPDGIALWGPNGVQAWSGGGFVASPKVAGTTDGNVVVAWTHESDVMVQKLDQDGVAVWGAGVTLSPPTDSFALCDLRAADAGAVIVSFIHGTGFSSPRHLWAQKLAAADGAHLWGTGNVQVYDQPGGSLQFGSFPPFIGDGSGGAVFAWYTGSPTLQCRVQRVLATGAEAFAHQGVEVSTDASRLRVDPSAAFLATTQEVVAFWVEENGSQSQWGLYAQKLDAAGVRQWTDSGRELVPLGGDQIANVVTLPFDDGGVAAWSGGLAWGNEPIHATRVDGGGNFVWVPPIIDLKTSATGTSRLVGALSSLGFAAYAWSDGDPSTADILAQNLNGDGSLGAAVAIFTDGFESGDTSAWSATVP